MQSFCKYLNEFYVPSDRTLNRAHFKFRINYRLIIVRCKSTKLTPILPRSLYFSFISRCLKFRQPDSCSQADQQTAANLVQVEAVTTEAQC